MTVKRHHSWGSAEDETGGYVKYDDYAVLKAERDDLNKQVVSLAVENAELKTSQSAIYDYTHHFTNSDDREMWNAMHDIYKLSSPLQTPATDAAIANWQAQGVEKFGDDLLSDLRGDCWDEHDIKYIEMALNHHLNELSKGASND